MSSREVQGNLVRSAPRGESGGLWSVAVQEPTGVLASGPPPPHSRPPPSRAGWSLTYHSSNKNAHGGPGCQGGQAGDHGNHELLWVSEPEWGHAGVGGVRGMGRWT